MLVNKRPKTVNNEPMLTNTELKTVNNEPMLTNTELKTVNKKPKTVNNELMLGQHAPKMVEISKKTLGKVAGKMNQMAIKSCLIKYQTASLSQ